MEFIYPTIKENDVIALYKISFDDKWFYIGSSCCLRNRIWAWVTMLRDIKRVKYSKLKDIFCLVSTAKLEIIEILPTIPKNFNLVRDMEHALISDNWGNEFLLNTSKKTFQNYGVHQVSHKEIIKFNSISDAAKYNNLCDATIRKALRSKSGFYKGYIWKYA